MGSNSTAELVQGRLNGWLIAIACFVVGIGGASLLAGRPWGMFVGFIVGALLTVIGISLLISRY
jgi:hypothetical protein